MGTFIKFFGIGIIILMLLVLIVMTYVSAGFSKVNLKDKFGVTSDYSWYFPECYESAREKFRALSLEVKLRYKGVDIQEVKIPSSFDHDLTMGVCYIPAQKQSNNLIILSSGVHGVEGYTGHAAQELFIRQFLDDDLINNTGVLLVHSVNPYGFKYTRRVTENNVDLNRNSTFTADLYQLSNEAYPQVYDLINPKKKVKLGSLENRFFFLKALNKLRKSSIGALRQAVLQGQYQYPDGIYFGGSQPEPQIEALKGVFEKYSPEYKKILMLDFHTGYGKRGKLHLFVNPMKDKDVRKLKRLFHGYQIDWGDSEDFYTITGDFLEFASTIFGNKDFFPMLFEYGTLNSQTTLGAIKSLHVIILENQGQHQGFASKKDFLKAKSDFKEMFFPSSPKWRNYILDQTKEIFEVVLPRFTEDNLSP